MADVGVQDGRVTLSQASHAQPSPGLCPTAADGSSIATSRVVLAPGHSARDLYRTLLARDVAITPKPFALGFR